MRTIRLTAIALLLTSCGRSPGPESECQEPRADLLTVTSFEGGEAAFAMSGNFARYDPGMARTGNEVAQLSDGSGEIRTTEPLRPRGTRVAIGFWLSNGSGPGALMARASVDGGQSWTASSTPLPALSASRSSWAYAEASFAVDPKANGYLFSVEVRDFVGTHVYIDDLRIVEYDVCMDDLPQAELEPMVFIPESATIKGFWIDRYEATVDLDHGLGDVDQSGGSNGTTTAVALVRKGAQPRASIGYYQARAACENAGKRLCTNLELERACSGDAALEYPYGDTYVDGHCSEAGREPTGSFPECVSPFGVYDLVGNVEEWAENVSVNGYGEPVGIGGSFNNPGRCNVLHPRFYYDRNGYNGFRCCRN